MWAPELKVSVAFTCIVLVKNRCKPCKCNESNDYFPVCFSGEAWPQNIVYLHKSLSNVLLLTFKTDSSIAKRGFQALWTAVRLKPPQEMSCFNQTLVQNTGLIQSPGFDVDPALDGVKIMEPAEIDCWITLQAPGELELLCLCGFVQIHRKCIFWKEELSTSC